MKRLAIAFGIALIAAGLVGFVPALSFDGLLFGLLAVDPVHNGVHIATGLFGVAMGAAGESQSKWYFRIVGVAYLALVALGFFIASDSELMGMAHNTADLMLHAAVAAVTLYLGFFREFRALPPGPRGDGPDLRGA